MHALDATTALPTTRRDVVLDYTDVAEWGKIQRRPDGRIRLRFGRRAIYSDRGEPFRDEEHADHVLKSIRGRAQTIGKDAALDAFAPRAIERNRLSRFMAVYLGQVEALVEARERTPATLEDYRRWFAPDGHIGAFWCDRSIYAVTTREVSRWSAWLATRQVGDVRSRKGGPKPLSAKTRWNITAGLHRFFGWLVEEEAIERVPRFRWPKASRALPTIISPATQQAILEAIDPPERGVFLVMARFGVRPSEAVELRVRDLRDGWIHVQRARKGKGRDAPIWGTKTGAPKALPLTPDIAEWIAQHAAGLHGDELLFPNPRTGRAWTYTALHREWREACDAVGVKVKLYEGTKHASGTDLRRRGVPLDVIQRVFGHADPRSTALYAQLEDQAVVEALIPRRQSAQDETSRAGATRASRDREKQ